MLKKLFVPLSFLFFAGTIFAQDAPFTIAVEEMPFPGFPALQSFVAGKHDGKWILIGGRTDGLHRRQPFAAFDPDFNNTTVFVVDIAAQQVWSKLLSGLPTGIAEQLSSTNMEFVQRGENLYALGGYGYSPSQDEWITYPFLTAIHLPGLVEAVITGGDIAPHFRSLMDERVRVTGGYLGLLDDVFFLVGGQNFEGRYNPMGPTHGPGFFQEYTNAIKKFTIEDDGTELAITNYVETVDSANLHRRDYNMAPQVFPDGSAGFTVFSGVFQYEEDWPWLNTVDVTPAGYTVNNDFNQFLNQYHTAHAALFSISENEMYTLFFGGISRYFLNPAGVLVDDPEVPFVKTISLVSRYGDGSMKEFKLGEMPGLLGSGAEFFPSDGLPTLPNGIIALDGLSDGQTIGYVVGGIESTLPNVFFLNGNNLSAASGRVFKVNLSKKATSTVEIGPAQYFGLNLFPNPTSGKLTASFSVPLDDEVLLSIADTSGKVLKLEKRNLEFGEYELQFDLAGWASGIYFFEIKNRKFSLVKQFVKE